MHFWSIKEVYSLRNANNLNFKLFFRLYTWPTKQVFCLYIRRMLDNESFWISLKLTFLAFKNKLYKLGGGENVLKLKFYSSSWYGGGGGRFSWEQKAAVLLVLLVLLLREMFHRWEIRSTVNNHTIALRRLEHIISIVEVISRQNWQQGVSLALPGKTAPDPWYQRWQVWWPLWEDRNC